MTYHSEHIKGGNLQDSAHDCSDSEDSWDDEGDDDEDDYFESVDDKPQQVDDKLFIGSMAAEHNLAGLRVAGITHVLQVAEGLHPSHEAEGLAYRTLHVSDTSSEDLVAHFPRAFDFIREAHAAGGGVLVHCVAGVSRSATVVVGWLMWRHRLGLEEAFRRVHRVRPWVAPNAGFRRQLERFEALGCDPARWTSWRHVWREEPLRLKLGAGWRGREEEVVTGTDGEPLPSL